MKTITVGLTAMLILALVLLVSTAAPEAVADLSADAAGAADDSTVIAPARVVATYFHGTARCATCRKLEAYSHEAIMQNFPEELAAGTLEWRTVNYDTEENQHYIDDYQLYTKAVILSRVTDDQEVEWKNLDQIWKLVGDKQEYLQYIQSETAAFMTVDSSETE